MATGGGAATGGGTGLDTWVCGGCTNASDMNPGTQALPLKTIAHGLQNATAISKAVVSIASTFKGQNLTYAEDVTLVPGVTLQGRWAVNAAGTWTRTAPRSLIANTAATGVKAPAGLTATAGLDGIAVQQGGNGTHLAGITVGASAPTLNDFDVRPPVGIGTPPESVGIDILGTANAPARPTLTGTSAQPSTVQAGPGTGSSIGIFSLNAVVTVTGVQATAGDSSTLSVGALITESPGSSFTSSTFAAGVAQSCAGLAVRGGVTGTQVTSVTASGCGRPGITSSTAPKSTTGLSFDACTVMPGSLAPLVSKSTVSAGLATGTGSLAVGVTATNGCNVRFDSNTVTGGSGGLIGGNPETSVGLACSYKTITGGTGTDSACSVGNSTITGVAMGATATNAVGMLCEGTCATGNAQCRGSCGEVSGNVISSGQGSAMSHLTVRDSSPSVARNRIGAGAALLNQCPLNATVVGLLVADSASSFLNNFIVGGPCTVAVGVSHAVSRRSGDNSVASPTFNSNSIVSGVAGTSAALGSLVSVGVDLSNGSTSGASLSSGTWWNNVIAAGGTGLGANATQVAFRESAQNIDPVELRNNVFHAYGVGGAQQPNLYLNENSATLHTAANINAMMDLNASAGNLAGDPAFVSLSAADLHITANSLCRGAGTSMSALPSDIDLDPRPSPANTNPDIGADEIP